MKKISTYFFVFVMLLTLIPVNTAASETSHSRKDELLDLACEVFPEYSSSIRGENANAYSLPSSANNDEIVYSETRYISETQSLTYAQYSNGRSVIVNMIDESSLFDGEVIDEEFTTFTGGRYGTVSVEVATSAYGFPGVFTVNNFQYKIYDNTYDMITSIGSATMSDSMGYEAGNWQYAFTPKYNEDASGAAKVAFDATFYYLPGTGGIGEDDPRNAGSRITLNVSNNSVSVVVN